MIWYFVFTNSKRLDQDSRKGAYAFTLRPRKIMLKILQARLQQYVN